MGTRFILENGNDISIGEMIALGNGHITDDGLVMADGQDAPSPMHLHFIRDLPKPEDYILSRSGTDLEGIFRADEWEGCAPILAEHELIGKLM